MQIVFSNLPFYGWLGVAGCARAKQKKDIALSCRAMSVEISSLICFIHKEQQYQIDEYR